METTALTSPNFHHPKMNQLDQAMYFCFLNYQLRGTGASRKSRTFDSYVGGTTHWKYLFQIQRDLPVSPENHCVIL